MTSFPCTNLGVRFFFPANRSHHAYVMAIYHGMEFATRFGKWPTEGLLYVTGTLYVHPDSMELLAPRVGDVLYSKVGGGGSVEEMICEDRARQTGPHIIQRGGRIIQRNGKCFHWLDREPE